MSSDRSEPAGFVLPVVLFCLLVMTALAHGTYLLARHQAAASDAAGLTIRARLAAESGVRMAASVLARDSARLRWPAVGDSLEVAPVPAGPGATTRGLVVRLGPEWIWVEGRGAAGGAGRRARRRVVRLYWTLDPTTRVVRTAAVVEHGGALEVDGAGSLTRSGRIDPPSDWPEEHCDGLREELDRRSDFIGWAARASLVEPVGGGSRLPFLGLADGAALHRAADLRVLSESVTPGPPSDPTLCDGADPPGWGAPSDPSGPCGDHRPLVVREGALALEGGEGQGILAVAGDLELREGARFTGVVLVGGSLRVGAGALLEGAVRVRESVSVEAGGRIVGSPCAVHRALERRPRWRGPVLPPAAPWMPLE